jgi:hypothetical protein
VTCAALSTGYDIESDKTWCGICSIKGNSEAMSAGPHIYNSIQFNSIQFNSIQFNSIQFNAIKSYPMRVGRAESYKQILLVLSPGYFQFFRLALTVLIHLKHNNQVKLKYSKEEKWKLYLMELKN